MKRVFVTLGLEWFPFKRLVDLVDEIQREYPEHCDVFIQTGRTECRPEYCKWMSLLDPDAFVQKIRNADLVISHAGVGNVMTCLENGVKPCVFPRVSAFGEHVDDHQLEFCSVLEETGKAFVVWDEEQLKEAILNDSAVQLSGRDVPLASRSQLIDFLKSEIKR